MNGTWVRGAQASKFFGVCQETLRRWSKENRIEWRRTPGGQRVYRIDSGSTHVPESPKNSYVYIRVSSKKHQDDLERQELYMSSQFPGHKIIRDIGSGLNFKRRGLIKLLELSSQGLVSEIVVASKDRLCRFGFDLLEWQFSQNNTRLLVLDKTDKSPEEEFTEDILAVLQVFACRWNGRRSYSIKNKKNQIKVDISPEESSGELETFQSLQLQ